MIKTITAIIFLFIFSCGQGPESVTKEKYKSRSLTKERLSMIKYIATFCDMLDQNYEPMGQLSSYDLDKKSYLILCVNFKSIPADNYLMTFNIYNESNKIINQSSMKFNSTYPRTRFRYKLNKINSSPGRYRFEIMLNYYVIGNEYLDFVSNPLSNFSRTNAESDIPALTELTKEELSEIKYVAIFCNKLTNNFPDNKIDEYNLDGGKPLCIFIDWFNLFRSKYNVHINVYNSSNRIIQYFTHIFNPLSSTSWFIWFYENFNTNNSETGKHRFEILLNNTFIGNEYLDFTIAKPSDVTISPAGTVMETNQSSKAQQ